MSHTINGSNEKPPENPVPSSDNVHEPSHYQHGSMEVIDLMRNAVSPEEFQAHCRLTAMKYLLRAGYKNDAVEDLEKAKAYIDFMEDSINPDGQDEVIFYANDELYTTMGGKYSRSRGGIVPESKLGGATV